jgi:hypothetical protein
VLLVLLASSALVVEAGQNCICECVKLCVRADIPSMRACYPTDLIAARPISSFRCVVLYVIGADPW